MDKKPFKKIHEQIDILEGRGLLIEDEEAAKKTLIRSGYYEVINGYKDAFMIDPTDDKSGFIPGTKFAHIKALFELDQRIGSAVLSSLEIFERNLKQVLAYVVSENIGSDQRKYTNKANFSIGEIHRFKHGSKSDRDILEGQFRFTLKHLQTEPFIHYRNDNGNIPPWIMVKNFSLGNILYWYRLSSTDIRLKVISKLLNLPPELITTADESMQITQSIGDTFDLCLEYRNLAAHGGRVYNHRNNQRALTYTSFLYQADKLGWEHSKTSHTQGKYSSSIGALLIALSRMENTAAYANLASWLYAFVLPYLKSYPEDLDYIFDSLEIRPLIPGKNIKKGLNDFLNKQ